MRKGDIKREEKALELDHEPTYSMQIPVEQMARSTPL